MLPILFLVGLALVSMGCLDFARRRQGNAGSFASEGEDFVPQLPMEDYMNLRHVDVTLGAAGAGGVAVVDTGLTVENMGDQAPRGLKWVLFGGMYQPATKADLEAWNAYGTGSLVVQLQRGTRVIGDLAARSAERVVAQGMLGVNNTAEGSIVFPLPLDLAYPTPVVRKKITILVGHNNHAKLNSRVWTVSLAFGFAAMTESDRAAIIQQSLSE